MVSGFSFLHVLCLLYMVSKYTELHLLSFLDSNLQLFGLLDMASEYSNVKLKLTSLAFLDMVCECAN